MATTPGSAAGGIWPTARLPRPRRLRRPWRRLGVLPGVLLGALVWGGCSLDGLLNSDQLPPGVTDPAITKTRDGARAAARGTLALFAHAFGGHPESVAPDNPSGVVNATGLLTDELYDHSQYAGTTPIGIDIRGLSDESMPAVYSALQKVRGQAGQAIGLLTAYAPEDSVRTAELYALAGYAEVFLADLFCSGIPLSTLDYNGDYTYQPGSTTDQVYAHAQALFDAALALAGDSVRVAHLARVGQARTLLAREQYSAAAAAAAAVPAEYAYDVSFAAVDNTGTGLGPARNFAATKGYVLSGEWIYSVANQEGGTGLDYVTSQDPRTPTTPGGGGTYQYPSRYAPDGSSPIRLASGVEARLIEAEAALQADPNGTSWLDQLNALRTNGTFEELAPGDTLWHAGSGGVDSLAPLQDPGASLGPAAAATARVDLLFHERAFWLFLTGHRQGDLRRLIRWYDRPQSAVYPSGSYRVGPFPYGSSVAAPIPAAERISNPLFTGCASTGA